jgi:hypothetical protein
VSGDLDWAMHIAVDKLEGPGGSCGRRWDSILKASVLESVPLSQLLPTSQPRSPPSPPWDAQYSVQDPVSTQDSALPVQHLFSHAEHQSMLVTDCGVSKVVCGPVSTVTDGQSTVTQVPPGRYRLVMAKFGSAIWFEPEPN